MDFTVSVNCRKKIKESEKSSLGADKKLWHVSVTVIPIVIFALETVPKGLGNRLRELKVRGKIETIQTRAMLKSARILKRVLEIL